MQDLEKTVDLRLMPLSHHKDRLVDVRDYSLQYADAVHPVFAELTFSIHQGERVALHGENGCGKSSLIKMILQKAASKTTDAAYPPSPMPVLEKAS